MLNNHIDKKNPVTITAYFMGTHLNFNSAKTKGLIYMSGDNVFLNSLHHFDNEFGKFMEWFDKSQYKDNTIIILTTDHTHYPDTEYLDLIKNNATLQKDFFPYFFDKIPFIVYGITSDSNYFDAKNKTSLSFAATVLHFLGYKHYRNIFLGSSIFDSTKDELYILSQGLINTMKCLKDNVIYEHDDCNNFEEFKIGVARITLNQKLELQNKLFDGNYIK